MIKVEWAVPWTNTAIGFGILPGQIRCDISHARRLGDVLRRYGMWHWTRKPWDRYVGKLTVHHWLLPFGYWLDMPLPRKPLPTHLVESIINNRCHEERLLMSHYAITAYMDYSLYSETSFVYPYDQFMTERKGWKMFTKLQAIHYIEQCGGQVV